MATFNRVIALFGGNLSGVKTTTIQDFNHDHDKRIKIRQCNYHNNIVEQIHPHTKGRCRAIFGFNSFHPAQKMLAVMV